MVLTFVFIVPFLIAAYVAWLHGRQKLAAGITAVGVVVLVPMLPVILFPILPLAFLAWLLGRHLHARWDELMEWVASGNSVITELLSRGSYFFLFLLFVSLAL